MFAKSIRTVMLGAWACNPHRHNSSRHKAADGNRTRDLVLTKDALYQLSYSSNFFLARCRADRAQHRATAAAQRHPRFFTTTGDNCYWQRHLQATYPCTYTQSRASITNQRIMSNAKPIQKTSNALPYLMTDLRKLNSVIDIMI